MAVYWGEKRYFSLDYYLKKTYGKKIYKLSLDGGMTCPNRDGTIGSTGCIFCSSQGSGDFSSDRRLSITEQITNGRERICRKYPGSSFIAYFQAFTNTYAPISYLRQIFTEAISHPEVEILSIATRPDCLSSEIIALLAELNCIKPVWIELGLQTIFEDTASYIRRGYTLEVFDKAVAELRRHNLCVIPHLILCLPGEDLSKMLASVQYLNSMNIQGVKLQLLHVLKDTVLAGDYCRSPFWLPSMDEYFYILGRCINILRPDIVLHRLTGDGPKALLLAPLWTGDKRMVLNRMQAYFKNHDIWQGKEF